ncbi:MAG: hypothetical protein CMN90_15735 [Sutterellaceae bacterium]|nr:hypothetical protein [Sutterellaceae bacterium]
MWGNWSWEHQDFWKRKSLVLTGPTYGEISLIHLERYTWGKPRDFLWGRDPWTEVNDDSHQQWPSLLLILKMNP